MMEAKGQIDLEQLFSYCEDLGAVFMDDKDDGSLADLLRCADSLRASSVADLDRLSSSIQDDNEFEEVDIIRPHDLSQSRDGDGGNW